MEDVKLLAGRLLSQHARTTARNFRESEFKVFSQFGDDGIIQFFISRLGIGRNLSNTLFLLLNDNWRGLVMDGDSQNIERIKSRDLYWRNDLSALCRWIDRDNINAILKDSGFHGEIGLLSIDIDGNDYWVWERIEVVNPVIVIAEYNSVFGARRAIAVPYDPKFHRTAAHYSNLYWGASLPALVLLAQRKGYAFVGCNLAGNNAYFVRSSHIGAGGVEAISVEEGYVESRFRESRDRQGRLTYLGGKARLEAIAEMPIYDIERGLTVPLGASV
jgi:hypothetical protein